MFWAFSLEIACGVMIPTSAGWVEFVLATAACIGWMIPGRRSTDRKWALTQADRTHNEQKG
jgi:hypothetical protein